MQSRRQGSRARVRVIAVVSCQLLFVKLVLCCACRSFTPTKLALPFVLQSVLPLYMRIIIWAFNFSLMLTQPIVVYYCAYVVFTWLGNFVSSFFFAFHLLDLLHRVETLKAVVKSVTYNGRQLIMTVLLVAVVVYIYTIFGFSIFRDTAVVVRTGVLRCPVLMLSL